MTADHKNLDDGGQGDAGATHLTRAPTRQRSASTSVPLGMASMVGWVTFAVEYAMFGLVLGALALRAAPADGTTDAVLGARSAMLSR